VRCTLQPAAADLGTLEFRKLLAFTYAEYYGVFCCKFLVRSESTAVKVKYYFLNTVLYSEQDFVESLKVQSSFYHASPTGAAQRSDSVLTSN
jgi:hypothetical protein